MGGEGFRARRCGWPNEWLTLGPRSSAPEIVAELEAALEGVHRSVIDVPARVAIELSGPGTKELLLERLFARPRSTRIGAVGMCAQRSSPRSP